MVGDIWTAYGEAVYVYLGGFVGIWCGMSVTDSGEGAISFGVCNDIVLLLRGDDKLSVLQYGGQLIWKQIFAGKLLQYGKGASGGGEKPRYSGVAFVKPAVEACHGGVETGGNIEACRSDAYSAGGRALGETVIFARVFAVCRS